MYCTYILRCADGSLYTGITTDPARRLREHQSKGRRCAKYTRKRTALRMEIVWQSEDRSTASRLEYHLKTLTRAQKEALISGEPLEACLGDKLDPALYHPLPPP